ncbi:MAG: hypothetical protein GY832_23105, partial [Chloroflexi bacterium]|nr:hypothetical protein [Chloroflexota bacterium]
ARDFAFKFAQSLIDHLKLGNYVKMGDMGSFSVSCDKDKQLNVNYRASKEIKYELDRDFQGEYTNAGNAGLDDEGYAQLWLELHPEDTVIMRDSSTRTAT